jgi:hypothetical protein
MQFKMVSLYTGFNFSELEIMVLEQARNTVIGLAFCTGDQLLYDLRRVVGRLIPNLLQYGATTKVSLHLAPSNGRKFLRLSQCRHPSPPPPPPPASPPTGPSMSSPATRASTSPSSRVSDYTLKALHPLSSTPSFPLSPRLVNGIPQRWWLPRRSASRALPRPRGSAWRSGVFRRSLPSRPGAMPRRRRGRLGLRPPAPARIYCWGSSERCVFRFSCNLT